MDTTEIVGDLVLFSSSGDDVRLVGRREVMKKSSLGGGKAETKFSIDSSEEATCDLTLLH